MKEVSEVSKFILNEVKEGRFDKKQASGILNKLLGAAPKQQNKDIAIIGMACRLPEADNKEQYWENLLSGVNSIRNFPEARRKDVESLLSRGQAHDSVPFLKGGYIEEIDKFDAPFFRIPPKEAEFIEPHQRLFLETVYEAFEDAGYGWDNLNNSNTGVFVGIDHTTKYDTNYPALSGKTDMLSMIGSWSGLLSSRASYILNLKGPSVVLDTACSSGLVAVHTACQSLRNKDCEMAIAGGVNLFLLPVDIGMLSDVESQEASLRPFDRDAMGSVWGEGVTGVVLKLLDKAIEDKDHIYAVIKGTAINNDGASNGITAPNAEAQEKLLIKAWEEAGVHPETLSYIETHGTGTKLGDPIEIKGITSAFNRYTNKRQFCGIGSVKSNIGHTVAASGVASLIKVVQMLRHKKMPPSLNFKGPNPYINFLDSPVYLVDGLKEWRAGDTPLRAGVSSFGFSGTNAHVVLEEAPTIPVTEPVTVETLHLIALSAKTPEGLHALVGRYWAFIQNHKTYNLYDVCYTANTGRRHCEHRKMLVVRDQADIENQVARLLQNPVQVTPASVSASDKAERRARALLRLQDYLDSGRTDEAALRELAELYESGADLEWNLFYLDCAGNKVSLPVYPFERKRYWVELPEILRADRSPVPAASAPAKQKPLKTILVTGLEEGAYSDMERTLATIWGNVMGFDAIHVHENFYELGGDSIMALTITNAINRTMQIEMDYANLFKYSTVSELSEHVAQLCRTKEPQKHEAMIQRAAEGEAHEATASQKRIYVLNELDGNQTTYNISWFTIITGKLDKARLERAFQDLVARHEVFCTSFVLEDQKIYQRIEPNAVFTLEFEQAAAADLDLCIERFVRPFDLSRAPLLRAGLVQFEVNKHLLMIDVHHIAADGGSIPLVQRELVSLYEGQPYEPLPLQFKDFAKWQNERFQTEVLKKQEYYWLETLSGELPVLELPLDYVRPTHQSFEGSNVMAYVDADLVARLNAVASESRATLFMVTLVAFNVLLAKYSQMDDIVVGTPISGRTHPAIENLIGMFINTLALRNFPAAQKRFSDFLEEVKQNALRAYENQEYPFDELVDKLQLHRNLSRNPLFDVMFAFQNSDNPTYEINQLRYEPYSFGDQTSKFDIILQVFPQQNGSLKLDLTYCSKLFKPETMQRFAAYLLQVLQAIADHKDQRIGEIDVLSGEEKQQLLHEFNLELGAEPQASIQELFERQVARNTDRPAVSCWDGALTFGELNRQGNQVAHALIGLGIVPGAVVGIVADRTIESMVGILGILKAGAAYLPLDSDSPEERNRYILESSGACLLLTSRQSAPLQSMFDHVLTMDDEQVLGQRADDPGVCNRPDDLAYILYTSGSTGKPKGVMIEHRNVINTVNAMKHEIYDEYDHELNLAVLASFVFDVSVQQIFAALLFGYPLFVVPNEVRKDGVQLVEYFRQHEIHITDGTPAYLNILSDVPSYTRLPMKHLIIAGEALPAGALRKYYSNFGPKHKPLITNAYGPTECCVYATSYRIDPETVDALDDVPIGRPLLNYRIYILDAEGKLCPPGMIGEIYIAGRGVGRGYLGQPELTDEKFFVDPYYPNNRMYKTGDRGKWNADGIIQYLGRADNQVKIRGFRIELDEITNQLLTHADVKNAVTVVKTNAQDTNFICAYLVTDNAHIEAELFSLLASALPEYMIPARFVIVERIPLTINGKVDWRSLPEPEAWAFETAPYAAPQNLDEQLLAEIWSSVLGVERIGIDDNFFALGGDSIKAIQTNARLSSHRKKLDFRNMFQYHTIRTLAPHLRAAKQADNSLVTGQSELAPMQHWLLDQYAPTLDHRNLAFMLYSEAGFAEEIVQAVFVKMVEHHDALRTVFEQADGRLIQCTRGLEGPGYEWNSFYLTNSTDVAADVGRLANRINASMSMEQGPLVKLGLFKTQGGDHLLIAIHQMVIDHISWRILFEDFANGYVQALKQQPIVLPDKTDSFLSWSDAVREYANGEAILEEKAFWQEIADIERTPLPTDYEAAALTIRDNRTLVRELPAEATDRLLSGEKLDNLLMTLFGLTLKERYGLDRFSFELGSHGREILNAHGLDFSRTVGRFSAIYPFVVDVAGDCPAADLVARNEQQLQRVLHAGSGYNILKFMVESSESELKFDFQPEISFNYMGEFGPRNTAARGLSDLSTGETLSLDENWPYKMKVVALLKFGQLHVEITYSAKQYEEEQIRSLLEQYLDKISEYLA